MSNIQRAFVLTPGLFKENLFNPDLIMGQLFQELCFFRFVGEDIDQIKVLSYTEN